MTRETSYRTILRSSTIVGGSSLANILIGLVKIKALALILGPLGIGLAGLLDSILRVVSVFAGLGLSTSGVRQLAISEADPVVVARVRRALFIANAVLGVAAGSLLWIFRRPVARHVFGNIDQATNVGWLGLGVLLTLVAASQTALLQGLRRIGDMAKVNVVGALAGTVGGVLAIWHWGQTGIVAFILLAPACTVVAGLCYVMRLPNVGGIRASLVELAPQWREMSVLGFAFMMTALLTEMTQLLVRSEIGRSLSIEAIGHFQAAWLISMQYIGFVLTAMAADYYPRLAGVIKDLESSNRMVNEQIQVSLLLGGPIMLGMLAMAPWVIALLYSNNFSESANILRWQVLGDVMKVAGWPMGFILIARAERGWFLFTQSLWNGSYILLVWLGLPLFGLAITGMAFFACYSLSFIVNCLVTHRIAGFRHTRSNLKLLAVLLTCAIIIVAASNINQICALVVGLFITVLFGAFALKRLLQLSEIHSTVPVLVAKLAPTFMRRKRP